MAMKSSQVSTPTGLTSVSPSSRRYSPPSANRISSRWPANMLANSRSASVNGRTRMFDKNSSGMRIASMGLGTPGGIVCSLK